MFPKEAIGEMSFADIGITATDHTTLAELQDYFKSNVISESLNEKMTVVDEENIR